jgi:iron only hydrogenase large subunit-like protein
MSDMYCIKCGQCILSCPVGSFTEQDHIEPVMKLLSDPLKHVVVQTAPSIRASLGEEFGMEPGTLVKGKMVAAARKLGFDRVFDTNLAADLTIIEESHELLDRVTNGGVLPMFTSCCPGWVKWVEHFRHDLIPHLSTCSSPHEMLGAVIKTYYGEHSRRERDAVHRQEVRVRKTAVARLCRLCALHKGVRQADKDEEDRFR